MATSNLKTLYFDIETTGLKADWSQALCIGYQVEGEEPECLRTTTWGPVGDWALIREFYKKVLSRDDIGLMVTHNGTRFDIPYLAAKMAKYDIGAFPAIAHVDTLMVARSKFQALSSRRLDNLSRFLGCKTKKTSVDPELWRYAAFGNKEAMDEIVHHCLLDIKVLKWVYKRIRPFMSRHPVLGDFDACHVCGGNNWQSRGYYTTRHTGRQVRLYCKACGSWTHRVLKKVKK